MTRAKQWAEAVAAGILLALAATPFVAPFPEPPAFGRGAATIVATVPVLAVVGVTSRADPARRQRILRRAGLLLAISAAAVVARILLAGDISAKVPTADILPKLFALQGEDVDDAVLYEVWVELWLLCAAVTASAVALRRGRRRPQGPAAPAPPRAAPWNAATIVLWLVGLAALAGAVLDGHWTTAFLDRAVHVTGRIADPQPHPRIRFTTTEGVVVEFTQDGYVSRAVGEAVPVAYLAPDPPGTARADTVWANWSDVFGLLWVGLGFTLFPFYGLRARFRVGRW